MYNFCTLFDSIYLNRGLAMYQSLKKVGLDFHLYIFAFDDLCYSILTRENLENTTIISLKEFETEELLNAKSNRSKAEYCWTCASSTVYYVLKNYDVKQCTYIDSDLYFYNSPTILEDEIPGQKSVLITEHRYSWLAKLYEEKRAGRFCVQYVSFKNNTEGLKVLETWKNQCLDWCYNRYEDGKFGDQKYLDEWPVKYTGIHILQNHGGGIAPWNSNQYKIRAFDEKIMLRPKNSSAWFNLIFYHFHYVRFQTDGKIDIGWHKIPKIIRKKLYLPYIQTLMNIDEQLKSKYPEYKPYYTIVKANGLKEFIKIAVKKIFTFNLLSAKKIQHGKTN